jgi:two-component system response regulator AtoC
MRILIVEDDLDIADVTRRQLTHWGYEVLSATTGADALRQQREQDPDLVLLDLGLPDMDGLAVLAELKRLNPDSSVIMLTGQADTQLVVQAMRSGAEDYLLKPTHWDEMKIRVEKVADGARLRRELQASRERESRGHLYLHNPRMAEVYRALQKVAGSARATVLILGETGTGKEHAARLLHQFSPRHKEAFQELHCAALPENLLESELFGYEPGAFTDAKKAKPGLLELAQGGTLFLDEIGELPLSMQGKLLKVLEDRQVRRLGGVRSLELDVRLVAATNRDLDAEVALGRFRADLLYRLKVFSVTLPPLRDRPEDIEALAKFFHAKFLEENHRRREPLAPELVAVLQSYPWPGNIRELKNMMERLVIQRPVGTPTLEDLPAELFGPRVPAASVPARGASSALPQSDPLPAAAALAHPEAGSKEALQALLDKHRWNKTRVALELGVSRPTLLKRLKEFGLD